MKGLASASWTLCVNDSDAAEAIISRDIDVVVFDTLTFNELEFLKVEKKAATVSISPFFDRLENVDVVIHRSSILPAAWQKPTFSPKVICGLDYLIGSPAVSKIPYEHYSNNLALEKFSVGVSMGGVDGPNLALKIVKELGKYSDRIEVWLAIGEGYSHSVDHLFESASESDLEMLVFKSNESMWRVFQNVSLLISAGGLTTYESAVAGIPSLCLVSNPEWEVLFHELEISGGISVMSTRSFFAEDSGALENLLDPHALLEMKKSLDDLNLTNGASRVARALLELT